MFEMKDGSFYVVRIETQTLGFSFFGGEKCNDSRDNAQNLNKQFKRNNSERVDVISGRKNHSAGALVRGLYTETMKDTPPTRPLIKPRPAPGGSGPVSAVLIRCVYIKPPAHTTRRLQTSSQTSAHVRLAGPV